MKFLNSTILFFAAAASLASTNVMASGDCVLKKSANHTNPGTREGRHGAKYGCTGTCTIKNGQVVRGCVLSTPPPGKTFCQAFPDSCQTPPPPAVGPVPMECECPSGFGGACADAKVATLSNPGSDGDVSAASCSGSGPVLQPTGQASGSSQLLQNKFQEISSPTQLDTNFRQGR